MADVVFNVALGKVKYYCELPAANDALIIHLVKTSGLEADGTIRDHDDMAALFAAANDPADFTNYAVKTITSGITITVDDTNNRVDIDFPDQTWTAAGGAANNSISALIVSYDPDTTSGTAVDSAVIPLTKHDFVVTTDGSDLVAQVASAGFFRAS